MVDVPPEESTLKKLISNVHRTVSLTEFPIVEMIGEKQSAQDPLALLILAEDKAEQEAKENSHLLKGEKP